MRGCAESPASKRLPMSIWGLTSRLSATSPSVTPDLARAPCDVVRDRFLYRGIEGRGHILTEKLLPQTGCPISRGAGARVPPILKARPVRQQRSIERGLVTGERVLRAEEMTASRRALDRLDGEIVVAEAHGLEDLGPMAQQLGVDDDLLEGRRQSPLEPAGSVIDQMAVAEDRRLQREASLVGRLRIHRRCGVHGAGAHGQPQATPNLCACEHRMHVLRSAERG